MQRFIRAGLIIFAMIIVAVIFFRLFPKENEKLLIDDFEGKLNNKTIDFGSSQESKITVTSSQKLAACGNSSLKMSYNLKPQGYMYCAKGYGLDAPESKWDIKYDKINWESYNAINFFVYADNNGTIAFDIKDAGGEIWRHLLDLDFVGWQEIKCDFSDFVPREDWQPSTSDGNKILNYPIKSFQWEPKIVGEGTLYFDCVSLDEK